MKTKTVSVWVIEQGEYSDYRVVGVYSTKENAEMVCAKINAHRGYDEASIAEWEMDAGVEAANKRTR
jgi:hypothetical protein